MCRVCFTLNGCENANGSRTTDASHTQTNIRPSGATVLTALTNGSIRQGQKKSAVLLSTYGPNGSGSTFWVLGRLRGGALART